MKNILFMLLPDDALILFIIFIGIGLIIGIFSRKVAFGYLGMLMLFLMLSPFIDSLFEILPLWLVLPILGFFILITTRAILNALFGKGATDTFIGLFLWNIFALPFRFIGYLFRIRR